MKNSKLFKTNFLVSVILIIGFLLTASFSYHANYQASLSNVEQVSSLTAEGIYYQLTTRFTKPVNVSLTMSHDSLLVEHLAVENDHLDDPSYVETIKKYLETYRAKYGFDSVFLVSTATSRYYNFNGIDRILDPENPENIWYYELLDSDLDYSLNVDNDEVEGAQNEITVFVNCKIYGAANQVMGTVGVGIRISHLKELLESYEEKFGVKASLIDSRGLIQISTTYTGYEQVDWFEENGQEGIRKDVLNWKNDLENLELWTDETNEARVDSYVVSRYIPELNWHLLVDQNTESLLEEMRTQMYQTVFLIALVILIVLVIITTVIRNFNRQITQLMEERQELFKKATEQMYDNIYEFNITRNCNEGKRTKEYFESLGAKGVPYDEGLRVVAQKQIKEEFREGYISTFQPANVIREYEKGNNHLRYDFMIAQDGDNYHWLRIDAYIFYSPEDKSVHMFTYRKNIDEEKQQERMAATDEMTGFLTKKATERKISALLAEHPDQTYAFFIFDIDNFKQANDKFGHAFGDECIREFTRVIAGRFRKEDLLGRIGGDEFAAFIPVPDAAWVEEKVRELSKALDIDCQSSEASWHMSASIGVSVKRAGDTDFDTLYRTADAALYQTKQRGKNGFSIADDSVGTKEENT